MLDTNITVVVRSDLKKKKKEKKHGWLKGVDLGYPKMFPSFNFF
jgi:hypothetical protein